MPRSAVQRCRRIHPKWSPLPVPDRPPRPLRNQLLLYALLSLSITACSIAQTKDTATVDLNIRYQTFEGWGTSLAWWANVVGGYPDAYRNDYINRFFDPVTGLGLN